MDSCTSTGEILSLTSPSRCGMRVRAGITLSPRVLATAIPPNRHALAFILILVLVALPPNKYFATDSWSGEGRSGHPQFGPYIILVGRALRGVCPGCGLGAVKQRRP